MSYGAPWLRSAKTPSATAFRHHHPQKRWRPPRESRIWRNPDRRLRRKPNPSKTIRRWIEADNSPVDAAQDRFILLSYNVLGCDNASNHGDLYVNIPCDVLRWDSRKHLICQEICRWNADIVCLQEVDRYHDILTNVKKEGYAGRYKRRTGEAKDGCAIFWKEKRFRVLEEETIEFTAFGLRENVAQLFVFEATPSAAKSIRKILYLLETYAGLTVNSAKTKIFFNQNCRCRLQILNMLNFAEGALPVRYLGIPLSTTNLNKVDCNDLLSRVERKLQGWVSKLISYAGRIQLINSVIYGIVLYWIQYFNILKAVIHKLNQLCAKFIWNGKKHAVGWETIAVPKTEGGLGLRDLNDLQDALTLKKLWRFLQGDTLWADWMRSRYCANIAVFWQLHIDTNASGMWKCILRAREKAKGCITKLIGDGSSTAFWHEPWVNNTVLVQQVGWSSIPLYGNMQDKVSNYITAGNWNSKTLLLPPLLAATVRRTPIRGGTDSWSWSASPNGYCTLKSCWNYTRVTRPTVQWTDAIWFKGGA